MRDDLAPIVIFIYRRNIDDVLEKLLQNKLSKKSALFIFSDGYKNEQDKVDVLKVRESLKKIDGFKSINIFESNINKGLANSIIDGVTQIIDKYDKIIVLEDDLIVADNFLEYMNNSLDFYEQNENIWSISGYSPNLKCLEKYDKDIYLSTRASSWGWATWKDRWESIDWKINDWNSFRKDKHAIELFNQGGDDMFKMLELQMLGKIDSWAIRWCYNQFQHNKYTIYPTNSKLLNIGFDSKGTHNSRGSQRWKVEVSNKNVEFENIEYDEEVQNCFKKYYNLKFITKIGYILKKTGGYKLVKKILNKVSK